MNGQFFVAILLVIVVLYAEWKARSEEAAETKRILNDDDWGWDLK